MHQNTPSKDAALPTITEFLEARIAEDEAEARKYQKYEDDLHNEAVGWFDCTRVLAECATKRAIIESFQNVSKASKSISALDTKLTISGMGEGLRLALAALTFPYKDHADWNREWAKP